MNQLINAHITSSVSVRKRLASDMSNNATDKSKSTILLEKLSTPFFYDVQEVQELLQIGASVDTVNSEGDTPLQCASKYLPSQHEIIRCLLRQGSDTNAYNYSFRTPLHNLLASDTQKQGLKSLELLFEYGANVNLETDYNETPLHFALSCPIPEPALNSDLVQAHVDIVKLLINRGANVNAVDCNNFTPLKYALKNQVNHRVVEVLVKSGAHFKFKNIGSFYEVNQGEAGRSLDKFLLKYEKIELMELKNFRGNYDDYFVLPLHNVEGSYYRELVLYRHRCVLELERINDFKLPGNISLKDFFFRKRLKINRYPTDFFKVLYDTLFRDIFPIYKVVLLNIIENSQKSIWTEKLLKIYLFFKSAYCPLKFLKLDYFLANISRYLDSFSLFKLLVAFHMLLSRSVMLNEIIEDS